METLTEPDAPVDPVAPWNPLLEGYDQETVDDFVRAVEVEKARLQVEIDAAHRRERRAHSLIHMHETMLATMREAYAEVMVARWAAEARATTIRGRGRPAHPAR